MGPALYIAAIVKGQTRVLPSGRERGVFKHASLPSEPPDRGRHPDNQPVEYEAFASLEGILAQGTCRHKRGRTSRLAAVASDSAWTVCTTPRPSRHMPFQPSEILINPHERQAVDGRSFAPDGRAQDQRRAWISPLSGSLDSLIK